MADILDLFDPEITAWFTEKFGEPTRTQEAAWPVIAEGRHLLLTAPTGTGKTLAAFLWAINRLIRREWEPGGVRVLYVSPLKALNNDIRRNLITPLDELRERFEKAGIEMPAIEVRTRSGDTPQSERRRMISSPPAILITTPESLNLMVSAGRSREILTGVQTVILDEIHAVADSKRGTHLMLGVERLCSLSGEFQRIALSATVRPVDAVAGFVGGSRWIDDPRTGARVLKRRSVEIRENHERKKVSLSVRYLKRAEDESDESVWERIAGELREKIRERSATLIFVNARKLAEQITHLINGDGETVAYAHHGSLSKELRLAVEERLKSGSLGAIVATSSLEMGIDIGELDAVFLVETPFTVSSAVQRIGRSGHSVGRTSLGTIYTSHGKDILQAVVLSSLVNAGDIEATNPIEAPLDVLAQSLVAMIGIEPRQVDELYDFVRTCEPYRNLDRNAFDSVIDMLAGRYQETRLRELKPRIYLDRENGAVKASDGALRLVYASGGTIPDRGYYRLALQGSNATIGELDEEFVWERRVGDTFTLGTQMWKVVAIDHQKVSVAPFSGKMTSPPFWKGDAVFGSNHVSSKIGEFLETADAAFDKQLPLPIPSETSADDETVETLKDFLVSQRVHTSAALPHRHHLVIEETNLPGTDFTQVFLHTFWGSRANYPCAVALEALLEERGWVARSQSENDCIHLAFADMEPEDGMSAGNAVRAALHELCDTGINDLLRGRLESMGFFGGKFRENAGRALLLPRSGFGKRTPLWLTRLRSKRLADQVARIGNFPITVETWRTCMQDEFELEVLEQLLAEIARGEIVVSVVRSATPSPFTEGVVWQSMNGFVYVDDTPDPRAGSTVDDDIVRAALSGSDRPFLDMNIVDEIATKLDRTAVGYAPSPEDELISWIDERVVITDLEWERLCTAIRRDHLIDTVPHPGIADRLLRIDISTDPERVPQYLVSTVDSVARLLECVNIDSASIRAAVQGHGKEAIDTDLPPRLDALREIIRERYGEIPIEDILLQWLASRPAVTLHDAEVIFGPFHVDVVEVFESLREDESLVHGRFFESDDTDYYIEAGNLERILRTMRRRSRRTIKPVSSELLPLFFASWQGIATNPTAKEDAAASEAPASPGAGQHGTGHDLGRVLRQLEGFPAPAASWEEFVIPARIESYGTQMLDSYLSGTDVKWFGCGDRRLSFCPEENLDLYLEADHPGGADLELLDRLFPDPRGLYDFFTLHERSGLSTTELTNELWRLSWLGYVGCENFNVIRRGAASGFAATGPVEPGVGKKHDGPQQPGYGRSRRRRSRAEWSASRPTSGAWYRCEIPEAIDAVAEDELLRERVRVCIDRYGVVFKGILDRELPALSWSRLFRTMRLMELSGEIIGGYFFDGVPGIQFGSREAIALLSGGLSTSATYWLNASDPASICGLPTPELRPGHPERVASTFLAYEGEHLAAIIRRNGESVEFIGDAPLSRHLAVYRLLLHRSYNPGQSVKVLEIDGEPAVDSARVDVFLEAGFRKEYKSLNLWKY